MNIHVTVVTTTACCYTYDSRNTVVNALWLESRLLIVKIGGHTKLFDLYKPVLIYMTEVTMFLIVIIATKKLFNFNKLV